MVKRSRGIGFRLWAGFGLLMVLLVGQSAFSVLQFRKLQVQADALVQQHIGLLSAVGQMHDLAGHRQVSLRDLAGARDDQGVDQALTALQANAIQWDGVAHRFTGVAATAEVERVRDASRIIVAAAAEIKATERKLLDLPVAQQSAEARGRLVQDSTPRYQELNAMLRGFFSATKSDADASIARHAAHLQDLLILIASFAAAALVFGASIAYFSTRGVVRPLASAREAASRVARGDLSQELRRTGPGEIVELVGTLEEMRLSLAQAVTGIRQAADGVQEGSRSIERGNLSLSERTEQQASSLEETASSIEELTATVKQNADSAARASVLARDTTAVARRGGDAVRDVVATMQGIHEASRRIGDIIGVIDGIAFQTNILALNAAVEAARAGEQGRGFAVVASEVRVLAQRAAQAAKEIKTLIHDSVGRVDGGVHQVEAAGRTMDEIVQSATQADGVIAEIAAASAEQLAGIEQVNRAIVLMEGNTQQNAAMVEGAAAAAEHLSRQADLLVSAVAKFHLEGQAAARDPLFADGTSDEPLGHRLLHAPVLRRPALSAAA